MTTLTIVRELTAPGSAPAGLAWDGVHLWNADYGAARIFQLDISTPDAGKLIPTDTLLCPGALSGIAWDGHALWQAIHNDGALRRLNPAAHDIDQELPIKHGWLAGLAWDGRWLWAVAQQEGQLLAIDPQNGQVQRALPAPVAAGGLDFHDGYLWLGFPDRMIYDPVSESFDWATAQARFALAQIDPADGHEANRFALDFLPMGLAWVGDTLWLAHTRQRKLLQAKLI